MPPHKETALEKSIRHSIKSAEAAMKADRALIVAVMNKSPSCVTKLKKTLRDLGYIDEKDCVIERHEAKGPTLQPAPSPAKSPTDFCDEEQLPSSAQTLNDCDVGLLAYWLERCEPIVFNKHSLKALLKRNQRKVSKEPLLECTEFMTDIPRDLNIASLATVGGVAAMLMKKNEANSRRAESLRLPPMWGGSWRRHLHTLLPGRRGAPPGPVHRSFGPHRGQGLACEFLHRPDFVGHQQQLLEAARLHPALRHHDYACALLVGRATLHLSAPRQLGAGIAGLDERHR